ncbi:MAG: hypothetical protein COA82_09040 [Alkaliphilus sp.]|nr:hypothetical protein [Alkaliphilus sp. AH-315-G20]MBN4069844.1 hypothetical protein [bacterium AH-315-G05]PHS32809.1 MAG: hypothetical protein COA82_09040 [Alkaliphilus sp.]
MGIGPSTKETSLHHLRNPLLEGWGNSHTDYANTIEQIGKRGISVVGISFVGTQASFVVTNKYMDTIVDSNKSAKGVETEVVWQNSVDRIDARKALAFLKLKMRKSKEEQTL